MNFEYIVVAPERVLATYTKGAAELGLIFGDYLSWARAADDRMRVEADAIEEKEKANIEADKRAAEKSHARYREKLAEYGIWQDLPWPVRMLTSEPEYPQYPLFVGDYGAYLGLPMSFYKRLWIRHVDTAEALRKEADNMIESAKAEPKEFHFTERQFARMSEWGRGDVAEGVKKMIGHSRNA